MLYWNKWVCDWLTISVAGWVIWGSVRCFVFLIINILNKHNLQATLLQLTPNREYLDIFPFPFFNINCCRYATDVPCATCDDPGCELFLLPFYSSQSLYLATTFVEEAASPAGSLSKWAVFQDFLACPPLRKLHSVSVFLIYILLLLGLA